MIWRVPTIAISVIAAMTLSPVDLNAQEVKLIGSGASFPFPIYSSWFKDFSKQNKGVTVDYQAKGSGAGIQDFINHTVDFAGSDAAMTDEEIAKVPGGVVLLPVTAGEIVLAYNLPGNPKDLKLPHDVYPDIFLGKVTKWNDPRITAANPSLKLPDLPNHGRPPVGFQRHDLRVHQAPLGHQRNLRQGGRQRNDGAMAKERKDGGCAKE